MKKNEVVFSLLAVCLFLSCSFDQSKFVIEDIKDFNSEKFFYKDVMDSDINVFFLDLDNLNKGNSTVRTFKTDSSISVGSCDSYLVKIGNTEILVDCGYQTINSDAYTKQEYPYSFNYGYLRENVNNNILPKLTSICTDGMLEYLVVTHSDFDHIASLCAEGGIIDAFNKKIDVENLEGDIVTLKSIKNVIDFNSGVVALHSYYKIDKEKRLCRALYQTYLTKIESLIQQGTNYLPAAALFDSSIIANDGSTMSLENKLLATPNNMKKYLGNMFESTILQETRPNDAAFEYLDEVPKNSSYNDCVSKLGGTLDVENERYFYSINIKDIAEFRILYNWYYDFAYRQSFDDGNRGQPINNPSVCIEIISKNFKFLSLGDLGGNGENGLLNYYMNTSILKNVTLFKSSHHGSITNKENSFELYRMITPKIIVVTGCAQSPLEIKNSKAAYMKQEFFDNVYNALHDENGDLIEGLQDEPYILCTNIDWFRINETNYVGINESKPFYGDIKVRSSNDKVYLDYSFKGTIHALVKTGSQDDVVDFKTINDGKIVKIQDTEWFEKVGFYYGG